MAEMHNGRKEWGYSGSTGISLGQTLGDDNLEAEEQEGAADWLLQGTSRAQVAQRNEQYGHNNDESPSWLRVGRGQSCEIISSASSTGQV